jgi:SAM-dependent methyltransferase
MTVAAAQELVERARAHAANDETAEAFSCLERALDLDEHAAAALALMGDLYARRNEQLQAIGHYMLAIDEAPGEMAYKRRFLELAGRVPLNQRNEAVENTLRICLRTPGLDCMPAQLLWISCLAMSPGFDGVFLPEKCKAVGAPMPMGFLQRKQEWKAVYVPLFVEGLKKIVIYDVVFEVFLTHLRRRLLEGLADKHPPREERTALAAALAQYCFETEYIFDIAGPEAAKLKALHDGIETGEGAQDSLSLAVYACYLPLHGLKNAGAVESAHKAGPLAGLVRLQMTDHAALLKARDAVETATRIEDSVSRRVQAQYEESPYPRWRGYHAGFYDAGIESGVGTSPSILSAGCGTGMEAVQLAAAFSKGKVLGLDLSRMSLAYAGLKAKEHGVANVSFQQGDILRLAETGQSFDYIAAAGVLHHMADPKAGWRALLKSLKPGGLMRVGLYSKIAHRGLVAAQQVIVKNGFTPDAASMREFRRRSPELLPPEVLRDVMAHGDYFHLSMYRDLLFHAQDHRFDLLEISQILDELGLEFLRFLLVPAAFAEYRRAYPMDTAMTSLANWHAFEQKNPVLFRGMYQFWCRKPG